MTIIYLVLTLIAILCYLKKKHLSFLLCYVALMTDLFMLDTIGSSLRGSDLCFFMNFVLLPVAIKRRNRERINDKMINRIIKLFIGFIIFEFFYTILIGADTVGYALKVIRIPLMFLVYYPFSTIPLECYKRFLKIMLWITVLQGVLFLLQFIGINLLAGRFDNESFAFSFALNIPTLLYFYTLFCLDAKYVQKYKYLLLAFFLVILLLTFVRALIISVLLSIVIYIVMVRGLKRSMTIIIAMLVVAPIALNVMEKKSSVSGSGHSTTEELKLLFSGIDNLRYLADDAGSSVFRLAMLIERCDYLVSNPEYLLFGVGAIHEDSPNCYNRFTFSLGTRNEGRYWGKCLIESGDITWVPITLRYGLVGVVIHISIILLIVRLARKRKDVLRILFPLLIMFFIKSFDGPLFERPFPYVELSIYLSLFARCYTEKKELSI